MIRTFTLTALLLAAWAAPSLAGEGQGQGGGAGKQGRGGKLREACQADFEKHCKDAPHERGARMKCLEGHEANLSPACKEALAKARERWKGKENAGGGSGKPDKSGSGAPKSPPATP
jgi:hypothetical protein